MKRIGQKPGARAAATAERGGAASPRAEKLHKALADRGLGSRRQMEAWIAAGRVRVNGQAATVGDRVAPGDAIFVDGKPLGKPRSARLRVLLLNKRAGVIVTRRDPRGRDSVFDDLPPAGGGRWLSVGRLDVQTTGLLLLTNRGDLAHLLSHPSTGLDREYAVRASARLDADALDALKAGVRLDGRRERFSDIRYYNGRGANHWYHVVIMEGRNREVRRLFAAVGAEVTRLKRVRYGPVALPAWLPRGTRHELGRADVAALAALVGLRPPPRRDRRPAPGERSVLIPYPRLPARASGADTHSRAPAARPPSQQETSCPTEIPSAPL